MKIFNGPPKVFVLPLMCMLALLSCSTDKQRHDASDIDQKEASVSDASKGYQLLKKHCYVCHDPASSSHDEIIAPPMAAVKMRYSMTYKTEASFVEAIHDWTMDPTEEKALMRGAVNRFKVMPKQAFKSSDMRQIATYIYLHKLEEPDWFGAHAEEMHGQGSGKNTKP